MLSSAKNAPIAFAIFVVQLVSLEAVEHAQAA